MLIIGKDTRIFKLFSWCIQLQIAFNDGEPLRRDYINEGTDLCHLVRTILITAPAIILSELAAVCVLASAFFILPYNLFGTRGPVTSLVVIGGLFIIILVTFVIRDIAEGMKKRSTSIPVPRPPTFLNLLGTYLHAKKSRICPLVRFKEPSK